MPAPDELRARLRELVQECAAVRLDLSQLTFIDSSGLAVLTEGVRDARSRGRSLEVPHDGLHPQVRRVIEIVRIDQLFWPTTGHGGEIDS